VGEPAERAATRFRFGSHRGATLRIAAGLALAAAAAVMLILRVPTAFQGFNGSAAAEVGRNDLGGTLAAADMVGVNNDFVRAAFDTIPLNAYFAVLVPDPLQAQTTYGVSPVTIDAVPTMMEDDLLPRRLVETPQKGTYVLCYLCNTSPWDHRTHWLWKNSSGQVIGLVYR
jgi:hypothetical protein